MSDIRRQRVDNLKKCLSVEVSWGGPGIYGLRGDGAYSFILNRAPLENRAGSQPQYLPPLSVSNVANESVRYQPRFSIHRTLGMIDLV